MTETRRPTTTSTRARASARRVGFGEHPAVIVVDYQLAFTRGALAGDFPEAALRSTARICDAARALGAPVIYTVCAYEADLSDAGPFGVKCPGLVACARGTDGCEIDPLVAPAAGDVVLEKQQPSAFFGTDLHERLTARGVDTVDRVRHDDLGLRARDRRRRHVARLSRGRADRGRRRPREHAARPGALRHGPQVRGRRARARRARRARAPSR